jgi:hypothetical protein
MGIAFPGSVCSINGGKFKQPFITDVYDMLIINITSSFKTYRPPAFN